MLPLTAYFCYPAIIVAPHHIVGTQGVDADQPAALTVQIAKVSVKQLGIRSLVYASVIADTGVLNILAAIHMPIAGIVVGSKPAVALLLPMLPVVAHGNGTAGTIGITCRIAPIFGKLYPCCFIL